jgi:hypothetical protein
MAKKINYIHTTLGTEVATTESSGFNEVVESSALTAGKTYYVVCHALVEGSNANSVFKWRLLDNTNTAQLADSTLTKEPRAANETDSYTFVGKFTAGGDGGGLEFQQQAAASQTVRTQYVSMMIFDLTNMRSDDYFLVSDSTATEHTASYVNRVSKTVSRADAGDEWLVFAWGSFSLDSTGGSGKSAAMALAFTDGGATATAEPDVQEYGGDLTDVLTHMFTRTFTVGTSGEIIWNLQSRDPSLHGSTPNDYEAGALFGLRLNAFADFESVYTSGANAHADDSFDTEATVSITPSQAGPVIVAGSVLHTPGRHTRGLISRVQVDSSTTPNAIPDSQRSHTSNGNNTVLSSPHISSFTGARGVANTINFDSKLTDASVAQNVTNRSLAAFSTELDYDSSTVTGKMRRPGMYRRGNGRTTAKRLRR